jgi:hypothetical protein
MKRPLSFSLLFLAFSAGVLRSQSDNSLEKWWNGKSKQFFNFFSASIEPKARSSESTKQTNL